jgi:hypothetical protein
MAGTDQLKKRFWRFASAKWWLRAISLSGASFVILMILGYAALLGSPVLLPLAPYFFMAGTLSICAILLNPLLAALSLVLTYPAYLYARLLAARVKEAADSPFGPSAFDRAAIVTLSFFGNVYSLLFIPAAVLRVFVTAGEILFSYMGSLTPNRENEQEAALFDENGELVGNLLTVRFMKALFVRGLSLEKDILREDDNTAEKAILYAAKGLHYLTVGLVVDVVLRASLFPAWLIHKLDNWISAEGTKNNDTHQILSSLSKLLSAPAGLVMLFVTAIGQVASHPGKGDGVKELIDEVEALRTSAFDLSNTASNTRLGYTVVKDDSVVASLPKPVPGIASAGKGHNNHVPSRGLTLS